MIFTTNAKSPCPSRITFDTTESNQPEIATNHYSAKETLKNGSEILFSQEFWVAQAKMHDVDTTYTNYRLGNSLIEEVAACILGGYGIPAETGLCAFERIKLSGLLDDYYSYAEYERILREPLVVDGKVRKYRFANQKARYLSEAVRFLLSSPQPPCGPLSFRNYLLEIPGIGYKTASWITRNWLNSDEVAIIDIHIYRACVAAGIFPSSKSIDRDYMMLERLFISFANSIPCRPATLDNFMWNTMRRIGHFMQSPQQQRKKEEK